MNSQSKINSYVGFCVKSRSIIYGVNLIKEYKKKIHLVLMCGSISSNSKEQVFSIAKALRVKVVEFLNNDLEQVVNKKNCKACAVTNQELAKAILDNVNEVDYKIIIQQVGGTPNGY